MDVLNKPVSEIIGDYLFEIKDDYGNYLGYIINDLTELAWEFYDPENNFLDYFDTINDFLQLMDLQPHNVDMSSYNSEKLVEQGLFFPVTINYEISDFSRNKIFSTPKGLVPINFIKDIAKQYPGLKSSKANGWAKEGSLKVECKTTFDDTLKFLKDSGLYKSVLGLTIQGTYPNILEATGFQIEYADQIFEPVIFYIKYGDK